MGPPGRRQHLCLPVLPGAVVRAAHAHGRVLAEDGSHVLPALGLDGWVWQLPEGQRRRSCCQLAALQCPGVHQTGWGNHTSCSLHVPGQGPEPLLNLLRGAPLWGPRDSDCQPVPVPGPPELPGARPRRPHGWKRLARRASVCAGGTHASSLLSTSRSWATSASLGSSRPCSTASRKSCFCSTSGLSPREHFERQAEFHASTQDEA